MKRVVIALLAILLCSASAVSAMKLGIRQLSFHNSILPTDQTHGMYLGMPMGTRADIIFGADYFNYKFSSELSLSGTTQTTESSAKIGSAIVHGGIKMYFAEPGKGDVAGYLSGEVFYGFGIASVEAEGIAIDIDPIKDALSPYGFTATFGAEFFAADNFSVGGEVGLRYSITKIKGDSGILDLINLDGLGLAKSAGSPTTEDPSTDLTSMTVYTGISVNFAF